MTVSLGLKKYPSALAWASRGVRQYAGFTWTDAGKNVSFTDLKSRIASLGGTDLEGRLPTLPRNANNKLVMDGAPLGNALAGTQLLVPIETDAALRPPNLLFVRQGNQLHIMDAAKGVDIGQPANLPRDADTVLVGANKDFAVLMQANMAIGVDLKTHATWTQALKDAPRNPGRVVGGRGGGGGVSQLDAMQGQLQIIGGEVVIAGGGINGGFIGSDIAIIDPDGQVVSGTTAGADPESVRRAGFRILGNAARFTTARILNGNLLILAGNQLDAYTIETGKPAWGDAGGSARLPDGNPSCFVGNEDLLVAQIDDPSGRGVTFCAFDAQTGKPAKQFKLDNERTLWRALGDDGTLYVATDQSVAAYDMVSGQNRALWRRTDIGSRFAGAFVLTLDGLIVVNDSSEVACLSLDSGEPRWRADLHMPMMTTTGSSSPLRSCVVGDLVVFHSDDGSVAFKSQPQKADPTAPVRSDSAQLAWLATSLRDVPPRQALQAADTFIVEMLAGTTNNASRRVHFAFFESSGGKLHLHTASLADSKAAQDPIVRSWQVVDGGVAIETVKSSSVGANTPGSIYLWRAQSKP